MKRLCRKALPPVFPRTGIKSIRRLVGTAFFKDEDLKDLSVFRFLRWAEASLGLGVVPRYVTIPVSETDTQVISRHQYVKMWKEMMMLLPYLEQHNTVSAISQYLFVVI